MSIPPIPTRHDDGLDKRNLLLEIFPTVARVLIELPREDQRLVNWQPMSCPARMEIERIVGQKVERITTLEMHEQFVWLARLTGYALELADEVHQLDGKAALDFAGGYIAGETSTHDLFGGPETEKQALAAAIEQSPLRSSQASPFTNGFQARRDQRRAAAADGKESA
ncbi:MAG TPA: hypothetical protein PLQ95_03360 [Thiobacillus sp.]|nr:hypothetical protein [Thiobacillus sp.]